MGKMRDAVEKARDQFLYYEKQHLDKLNHSALLTPEQADDTRRKAKVNRDLAAEMQAALDDDPFDVLALERVQDYRFASMVKGQHYAFARGLTINPAHLPAALDAMQNDGFELVAIFGDPVSDKMGFVFRILGPDPRYAELLNRNNEMLEAKRESDRKLKAFLEGTPLEELREQD